MNTNLVHNILNIVIALLAALTAFMVATGCHVGAGDILVCTESWLDPRYTTPTIAVLGLVKTVINIARDGFSGLAKEQPPVK